MTPMRHGTDIRRFMASWDRWGHVPQREALGADHRALMQAVEQLAEVVWLTANFSLPKKSPNDIAEAYQSALRNWRAMNLDLGFGNFPPNVTHPGRHKRAAHGPSERPRAQSH